MQMLHLYTDLYPLWGKLHEGAMTVNDSAAPSIWKVVHGMEPFEFLAANPDRNSAFNKAMSAVDTQGATRQNVVYCYKAS